VDKPVDKPVDLPVDSDVDNLWTQKGLATHRGDLLRSAILLADRPQEVLQEDE
jgi:hypothetical protein